jgi:hypothetical protein
MSFRFVALGDAPYDKDHKAALVRLIELINGLRPAFTVHVGDMKHGGDSYADRVYLRGQKLLACFDHPFLYLPGDNDWSDSRSGPERLDPLDRLALVRRTLCGSGVPWPLPGGLVRQSDGGGRDAPYVENVRWLVGDAQCAAFHAVGSDKKRRSGARETERKRRLKANLRWLEAVMAESAYASCLILFTHANLWTDRTVARAGVAKGFRRYRDWLEARVPPFRRPVLLVHGDKHQLVIDQPLWRRSGERESVVQNFTRLQVCGGHQVGAVEVTVDPSAGTFAFRPLSAG